MLDSPGTGTIATIVIKNAPPAAPTAAPSFTTDNYSSGSPEWLMEFAGGGWLYGYPSNAGLGSSNWKTAAHGKCTTTTLHPAYGTYADMLAALVNAGCAGDVTEAGIFADGTQYPVLSDTITNIQYNGQTLAPGPDTVAVTSPGAQTGMAGTAISTLWIKASSNKGDTVGKYHAAGLPPGLSINEWDGSITGTPTTAGTFNVTVTATDNGLTSGNVTFRWQVSPAPSVTYNGTIRLTKRGLCLDDRNDSSRDGAVVQVWRCNGMANQQWLVWSDGTIQHNGLCLDARDYGTTNGIKVQLWACTGRANQKWDTKGWRIHYDNPAAVNKVLDDTGYGGDGTQQEIWTSTGGANQIWATY
ncbi:MAG TPA: ricin-type beta-trefoil lectin domain protein [Streptosporangiaceae bacterium]